MFYHGEPFTRGEMLIEISKLLVFIQMILDRLHSSIDEIMCINIAKLESRYPDGYTHDKAITHQRDKKAERVAVDAVIAIFSAMRYCSYGYCLHNNKNGQCAQNKFYSKCEIYTRSKV